METKTLIRAVIEHHFQATCLLAARIVNCAEPSVTREFIFTRYLKKSNDNTYDIFMGCVSFEELPSLNW